MISPTVLKISPHIYHDIPTVLNTPMALMISPTVLKISLHIYHDIPPRYSRYPPTVLMISPNSTHHIPHGTAHTLYRVVIIIYGSAVRVVKRYSKNQNIFVGFSKILKKL